VVFLAPHRGLWSLARRRASQKLLFGRKMLVIHLYNHEGLPEADLECRVEHLEDHLRWDHQFANRAVKSSIARSLILREGSLLMLTDEGRMLAREALVEF